MSKRKIGFIFECGPDGADIKVFRHLVALIDSNIEFVFKTLDDKKKLIANCSATAKLLLDDGCEKIFIVWDMFPPWRKNVRPCLKDDRCNILAKLNGVILNPDCVILLCISEELESWILADNNAVKEFIQEQIQPHPVKKITNYKNPDRVKNPKAVLNKMFNEFMGKSRKYVDYLDAFHIIKRVANFNKLKHSESFKRLYFKLTGTEL